MGAGMDIDLVVRNARVITMDAGRPFASAVAVRGGRIAAVGGDEVAALAGPGCRVVDAGGRTLSPGFGGGHLQLVLGGGERVQWQIGGGVGVEALPALTRWEKRRGRRMSARFLEDNDAAVRLSASGRNL